MPLALMLPTPNACRLATANADIINAFIEFNNHRQDVIFCDAPDKADVIVLFEEFSYKTWRHAETLEQDEFIRKFAHKVFVINYDDYGRGHLPGLYTSLTPRNFSPALHLACCYPKTYNECAGIAAANSSRRQRPPKWLFSFSGTLQSHPVRTKLYRLLAGADGSHITVIEQAFHTHSQQQKQAYVEEILDSVFVLCPRGWSPSTYRLFEVMALGRCPVIIADAWLPVAGIDWESCAIRVKERDIRRIPEILHRRAGEAETLGNNALTVWKEHFSLAARNHRYLEAILQLYGSPAHRQTSFEALAHRWHSCAFYAANGWTAPQRAADKIARLASAWKDKFNSTTA